MTINQAAHDNELAKEVERLTKLAYVPGLWRCAKCNFKLVQANLNANSGTVTARDEPGDKCPNCNSPLWRVTERQAGNELIDRMDAVTAENARLREACTYARTVMGRFPMFNDVVAAIRRCSDALTEKR